MSYQEPWFRKKVKEVGVSRPLTEEERSEVEAKLGHIQKVWPLIYGNYAFMVEEDGVRIYIDPKDSRRYDVTASNDVRKVVYDILPKDARPIIPDREWEWQCGYQEARMANKFSESYLNPSGQWKPEKCFI